MSRSSLNEQILLHEVANFRGSPKQFGTLARRLKQTFPEEPGNRQFTRIASSQMWKNRSIDNSKSLDHIFSGRSDEEYDYYAD